MLLLLHRKTSMPNCCGIINDSREDEHFKDAVTTTICLRPLTTALRPFEVTKFASGDIVGYSTEVWATKGPTDVRKVR